MSARVSLLGLVLLGLFLSLSVVNTVAQDDQIQRFLMDTRSSPQVSLFEDTGDAVKRTFGGPWRRRLNSRARVSRNSICCRKGRCCRKRFHCVFVPRLRDFYCIP